MKVFLMRIGFVSNINTLGGLNCLQATSLMWGSQLTLLVLGDFSKNLLNSARHFSSDLQCLMIAALFIYKKQLYLLVLILF